MAEQTETLFQLTGADAKAVIVRAAALRGQSGIVIGAARSQGSAGARAGTAALFACKHQPREKGKRDSATAAEHPWEAIATRGGKQ